MTITRKKVADDLTRIFENCRMSVAAYQAADRELQARGGAIRVSNKVADPQLLDNIREAVRSARDDALEVIEKAAESAEAALTEAPSTDVANYIVSISGRDDMKEREVRAALERYTSHAAQSAILAAANRSGIHIFGTLTSTEQYLDDLDGLEASVKLTYETYHSITGMTDVQAYSTVAEYKTFENHSGFNPDDVFLPVSQRVI